MRVAITGAGGQLGRDLVAAYAGHEVTPLAHVDLDVTDEPAVVAAVRDHRPDLVVNAAAWTDVDGCETDPDRAHAVNALGAWWLARACSLAGAAMVQVSTDYVFGAVPPRDGAAYTELEPPAPVNVYGATKAAGETLVRETLSRHYIVRTAWLYGTHGGFVADVLARQRAGEPLRAVTDQRGSPTATADLAAAIRTLSVTGRHGTFHRVNDGACSRHELAVAALELAGIETDVAAATGAELARPAARPVASLLDDRHSRLSGLGPLAPWRDALARTVAKLTA